MNRVLSLFQRRRIDADLDDEVRAHLELLASEYERRGLSAGQARLAARRAFGGIEQMKETYRDRRGLRWVEDARQDVHHALRSLRRAPVFAGASVLTLAVGLTAVTAIFAILNAFMFRPMPVDRPEELVSIGSGPDRHVPLPHGVSFLDMEDYRQERTTFVDLLGYNVDVAGLNVDNVTERITMYSITDNYFALLGVQPAIGRLIQPNEGRARGDAPVIVLTHEYWQARFGGDPSIVGRAVRLNGRPFTIIGVTPQSFDRAHSLIRPSAYVPLWMHDELAGDAAVGSLFESRESHQMWVLGRLQPGVSLLQARAALEVKTAALARQYPETNQGVSLIVIPETHARPNPNIGPFFRVAAMAFAGLAALLLLITSANVTNLLMARAVAREREVALRAALGAGRGRLVRQLLTESVVLAVLAGIITLPLVVQALSLVAQGLASSTSIATIRPDFSLDARVLGAGLLLVVIAGVVSGMGPAVMAMRTDLNGAVRAGGRGPAGEPRARFRSALVVFQVALSLMLLVSGGLFLRSLDRARQIELGFEPANLMVASVILTENGYNATERLDFFASARDRVRALPGVEQAAWTEWAPLATVSEGGPVWIDGQRPRSGEQAFMAASASVDANYFSASRVTILEGRAFDDRDAKTERQVAIVNETLARHFWPNQTPIGRSLVFRGQQVEVVGVARNGKYLFIWESPRGMLYQPLAQVPAERATLLVRGSRDPAGLMTEVQRVFREVDPAVRSFDVRTMDEHLVREGGGFLAFEIGATFAGIFGAAGVLLAAIGLYGMIAGRVTQRTQEFGVRIALGASRRAILRDVLGRALRLASLGIVGGALLAAFAAQGLSTLLLNVSPFDPLTYIVVSLFLVGVCLCASFIPARRATRVDPIVALRAE
ncbi:MAG TPA: ABC transporter permease [Vicinamibacterales bacterium]|nr:ABC transporter permease [Vicinamibacterales bacterium]